MRSRLLLCLMVLCLGAAGCAAKVDSADWVSLPDPDPSRQSIAVDFIWSREARWLEEDFEWLVDRMHPGTFDFWTRDECVSTLELTRPLDTAPLESLGVIGYYSEFTFDYGEDRIGSFTDAYRVETVEGGEAKVFTVGFVDGEPVWFGNCDPFVVT